jgi:hypothetical protein
MDFHQWHVIPGHSALSYVFLSFSVPSFTGWTSHPNALLRVSKSRTGDFHRWSALMEQNPSYWPQSIA